MTYAFTHGEISPSSIRLFAELGQIWQNFAEFGGIWRNLVEFGKIWQNLAHIGRIWVSRLDFRSRMGFGPQGWNLGLEAWV